MEDLQVIIDQEACTQCGSCINVCPRLVLELTSGYPQADPKKTNKCIHCQHCMAVCPPGALSILGKSPKNSQPIHKAMLPSPEQMELLIQSRRSIRKFQSTSLPSEKIERLLAGIEYAPTGVNRRQCLFSIVDSPDVMQNIRMDMMEAIRKKIKKRQIPKGLENYIVMVKAWDKGNDILFRGAPHMLLVSAPENISTTREDCIIALSYFELLAASMNIGTLWNGLLHWAFNLVVPEMLDKLELPASHKLGYIMLFGKPAVKYHRTVQRDKRPVKRINWT